MKAGEIVKRLVGQANTLCIPREFVRMLGSYERAALLAQIIYWSDRKGGGEFFKTDEEFMEELCLSPYQLAQARRALEPWGVTCERKGIPARMHYRFDMEVFENQFCSFLRTSSEEGGVSRENCDTSSAVFSLTSSRETEELIKETKITTKTTTKTTTTTPPTPPNPKGWKPSRMDYARPQPPSARGRLLLSLREKNLEERFNQRLRAGMREAAWFDWLDTLIPQFERLGEEFPEAVREALEALASAGRTTNDHRYFAGVVRRYVPTASRPRPAMAIPELTPDELAAQIAQLDAEIEAGRRRLYGDSEGKYAVS